MKNSKAAKGIHKNSATPSKDKTCESWAWKGEQVKAKGIRNILNKILTESFPNLKKKLSIQVQEASRTPNRFNQNKTSP
jgi:hypothetical protein